MLVVFGAAVWPGGRASPVMRRRVLAARRFGRTLTRPIYLPTGGIGRHKPAESAVMAALLRRTGIAAADIRQEPTATDTLSSARAVAALLRGHQGPVFACSSAYHLPRCVVLLRLLGVPATAAPPAVESWRDTWALALREIPALPYDALLALWRRPKRAIG